MDDFKYSVTVRLFSPVNNQFLDVYNAFQIPTKDIVHSAPEATLSHLHYASIFYFAVQNLRYKCQSPGSGWIVIKLLQSCSSLK